MSFLVCVDDEALAPGPEIAAALQGAFDLSPRGIIDRLDLGRPIYYPTAAYGCFGRDCLALPWEGIARAPAQGTRFAGTGRMRTVQHSSSIVRIAA